MILEINTVSKELPSSYSEIYPKEVSVPLDSLCDGVFNYVGDRSVVKDKITLMVNERYLDITQEEVNPYPHFVCSRP